MIKTFQHLGMPLEHACQISFPDCEERVYKKIYLKFQSTLNSFTILFTQSNILVPKVNLILEGFLPPNHLYERSSIEKQLDVFPMGTFFQGPGP